MAQLEKNVSVLTKKLKQANEELIASYKKIGSKLLLQVKDDDSLSSFVNDAEVVSYNKLVEDRAQATKDIIEIKSTSERLNELEKFKRQVMKSIKEIEASQAKMKVRFSILLYKEHKHEISFASLEDYEEIQKIESSIDDLLLDNETLNEEKKDAGFLAKFNLNRKIAGNRLKLSILKRNLEKQISRNASAICEFHAIGTLLTCTHVEELKDLYGKITEQQSMEEDMSAKLDSINEEAEILANRLAELSSGASSSKQIASLTEKVNEIDKEVDDLLQKIAIDFLKNFINDDNVLIEDKKEVNSGVYQHYANDFDDVLNIRQEITVINFNIEYCDVTRRKEEAEYKITVMNNAIVSCEEGIKNYQKRLASLNENIAESSRDIEEMEEHLAELKTLIET